jgi:hypothetical protein
MTTCLHSATCDILVLTACYDCRYGPAAGMTRLERWKRASNWGLDPPAEVGFDIVLTKHVLE